MYRIQTEDEYGNYAEVLGEYDHAEQAYEALSEFESIYGNLEDIHLYKWSDFAGTFIEL